ncbi:alkene reductase [Burkholderia sp. WAC0059]|uniref:alkene reductase n=1 Tax=Burkholderia sp. WAC0059 TaxID=2066022 RepID=UPI000C7E989F|nr:alkene reductase [Burkholderia sp. WAC0059]PLZ01934.1 alkene reductase [Burkholderia sp. WAC0059]
MSTPDDVLFRPIRLGEVELPNRIVMASMSRARTDNPGLIPVPLQAEYYRQRASAGLILSEGTWPNRDAIGAINVPGLFDEQQAEGWKRVTGAVHEAGGRIFVQLGHCGAVSHPDLLGGAPPLAPSAVSVAQPVFTPGGFQVSPVPKAMTADDIARTIDDYARATRLAQQAGFDGVELHGTVGYLIPEFLNDRFNLREDRYGGSIENRARFPLEVLEAMIAAWRPGRIGLKLSPGASLGELQPTAQTLPTYEYLVSQVAKLKIAYLQLQHPDVDLAGTPVEALNDGTARYFRRFYDGVLMANGGLDRERAEAVIRAGDADLAAFGTPYLANPDFVERLKRGAALAPVPPRETWYAGGAAGYADYPNAG